MSIFVFDRIDNIVRKGEKICRLSFVHQFVIDVKIDSSVYERTQYLCFLSLVLVFSLFLPIPTNSFVGLYRHTPKVMTVDFVGNFCASTKIVFEDSKHQQIPIKSSWYKPLAGKASNQ